MMRSSVPSNRRSSSVLLCAVSAFMKCAQIIGVTLSETTAEMTDRERHGHGELVQQAADDAGHEQHRDEGCNERHRDRDHGEADLARAIERGLHGRRALLHVGVDVLDHDDGVVDDEADGHRKRHERQVVDREARGPHGGAGAGERQRHGDAGGDGRRRASQEHQHHGHHEGNGQAERDLHVMHGRSNGAGTVGQDRDVDAGRNPLLQVGQQRFDAVDGLDDVGVGLLGDDEQHCRIMIEAGRGAGVAGGDLARWRCRPGGRCCRWPDA